MATLTLLGHSNRVSHASGLEREGIITVYGHSKVNFVRAPLAPGDHTLRVVTFGGDVKLRLPESVGIEIHGTTVYSEVKIETLATGKEEEPTANWTSNNFEHAMVRVRIYTLALFGGIEILRVPDGAEDAAPYTEAMWTDHERSYEGETRRLHNDP